MSDGAAKTTVLIVDDEELITLELSAVFADLGYDVCGTAVTAPEALRLSSRLRPGLITMDINLGAPGEGFAAVTLIRTSDILTPVLFITGGSEADSGDAIRAFGRAEYVQKPFARGDIAAALARLAASEDDDEG
jgi:CheY-like chemotaxis protein